jgi:hypothetical protein
MATEELTKVGESTVVESALMWACVAIRGVHLIQGAICVASGWSTYRRPRLAGAVLGVVGAESIWMIHRTITRRDFDDVGARVDAVTGAAGLGGCGETPPVLVRRLNDRAP